MRLEKKVALLFLLFVINISNSLSINNLTFSPDKNEFYLGDGSFVVSFACENESSAGINITSGGSVVYQPVVDKIGNTYSATITLDDLQTGNFILHAYCKNSTNIVEETKEFSVYDLELCLVEPVTQIVTYPGDELDVRFVLNKIKGTQKELIGNDSFDLTLYGPCNIYLLSRRKADVIMGKLKLSAEIPEEFDEECFGVYDLVLKENTHEKTLSKENLIDIRKPFDAEFLDTNDLKISGGGAIEMRIRVEYNAGTFDKNKLSFETEINGFTQEINDFTCELTEQGRICSFYVSLPELDPGDYPLKVRVRYDEFSLTLQKTLHTTLKFKGILTMSNGQVVDAVMDLYNRERNEWYSSIKPNPGTGEYSVDILPGTYDLKATFPQIHELKITGIKITKDTQAVSYSPIKYDYFAGGVKIPGIDAIEVVVLQFALPMESASMLLSYDDRNVYDENKLEVFFCKDWSYGSRRCSGEWKRINFTLNTVSNLVYFVTNELGAFVIGGRKPLGMEIDFGGDEHYAGDTVTITGKIIDNEEKPVQGVKIKYTLENVTGESVTDRYGRFTITLTLPQVEGVVTLTVNATKEPFISVSVQHSYSLKKKKDFIITLPDKTEVMLGGNNTVKLSVFNSGQKNITDIYINLIGIPNTWYSVIPRSINLLEPGETKDVDILFHISPEECKENCKLVNFVEIEVKSKDLTKKKSLTLQIKKVVETSESPLAPTGMLIATIADTVINPSTIAVLLLTFIFFGVTKLKRRERKTKYAFHPSAKLLKKLSTRHLTSPARVAPRENIVPFLYKIKKRSKENESE